MKNKKIVRAIEWYQVKISKNSIPRCRHIPTCSEYGKECYERFNFFKATFLTTKRILTCNPLFKPKYDPVPEPKRKKGDKSFDKIVLLSGFNSFGGDDSNVTELVISLMPEYFDQFKIVPTILNTSFKSSSEDFILLIEQVKPDIVIMLGEAKKRDLVSLESRAINLITTEIPDNDGIKINNKLIKEKGFEFLTTNVNLDELNKKLNDRKYPVEISNDAGRYVCNYLYFNVLDYINTHNLNIPTLFVHLPKSYEQSTDEINYPYQTRLLKDVVRYIIRNIS